MSTVTRDLQGRLLPGSALAGGVTKGKWTEQAKLLRTALVRVITQEEADNLVRRMLQLIHQNDDLQVARQTLSDLLNRLGGKPKESIDVEVTTTGPTFDATLLTDEQLAAVVGIIDNAQPAQPAPQLPGPLVIDVEPIPSTPTEQPAPQSAIDWPTSLKSDKPTLKPTYLKPGWTILE